MQIGNLRIGSSRWGCNYGDACFPNRNLLRFFWSGLRHHRPREERILVSGAWECLRPPFLHLFDVPTFPISRSDLPTFLIRCSINCRGIVKIHRRLRNRCRLLHRSCHPLTLSLRPVLRQRGLHLGRNPKPPHRKLSTAPFLIGSTVFALKSTPENKQSPSFEIIESPDLPVLASVPIVCG
ncbi:hypothetical protein VitviT2T_021590 [Vitis vinifera]|uniref:Uncharacterized protein n=1 Tax=Vitis vinifera TaxID=29760 RepID=A0ABY9D7F5_VITVI|nr:hypothetical protein VitviT2T_021590 [Vitis vinifera]